MIFAADLDRTLIFSKKRLNPEGPAVIPVELREGSPAGFMTPAALRYLRELVRRSVCFINTMRGLEQSRRVAFVADGSCKYLALQNGLSLFRNGKEDVGWSNHVRGHVEGLPLPLAEGAARVLRALPGIERLSKRYEYLAVFFVDEEAFDDPACVELACEFAALGWALCRQRRKLYLYPKGIDKGTVLTRVRDWEDGVEVTGFGDSGFDLPMLGLCHEAWSLKDSELWADAADMSYIRFSSAPAQAGTEEVLSSILSNLGEY